MPSRRLPPKRVEKPWGRCDVPGVSGAGDQPVGELWFEAPGDPELLVKYLFTSDRLSIQVHPDDVAARALGHARGKDEAWLILAAEPHASIALGTLSPMTPEELRAAALDGSVVDKLGWRAVKAGDSFYSPAGTIHAIGRGLTLVEVQQNLDVTFRLYDYGSERELHLDRGIAVAKPLPFVAPYVPRTIAPGRTVLAEGPAFVMERWSRVGAGTLSAPPDRPVWLVPLGGGGLIGGEAMEAGAVWLSEGDSALTLEPGSDLLLAYAGADVVDALWA